MAIFESLIFNSFVQRSRLFGTFVHSILKLLFETPIWSSYFNLLFGATKKKDLRSDTLVGKLVAEICPFRGIFSSNFNLVFQRPISTLVFGFLAGLFGRLFRFNFLNLIFDLPF